MIEFLVFVPVFPLGMRLLHPCSSDCHLLRCPLPPPADERRPLSQGTGAGPWKPVRVGYVRQHDTVRRKRRRAIDLPCS